MKIDDSVDENNIIDLINDGLKRATKAVQTNDARGEVANEYGYHPGIQNYKNYSLFP